MHAPNPPATAGSPPHALRLPRHGEACLFPDAPDAGWLVALIAAHQVVPEVVGLGLQCWSLVVPEATSARLTCQGWRGGPDVVSLLLPARCLPPELYRGAGVHEFLVADGALWTEAAWCGAGESAS